MINMREKLGGQEKGPLNGMHNNNMVIILLKKKEFTLNAQKPS